MSLLALALISNFVIGSLLSSIQRIYIFLVNSKPAGFFACKRGVPQGNPLSPLLFYLVEEALSRGISSFVQQGLMHSLVGPQVVCFPSHAFFANDLMVFCRGTKNSLQHLMNLLSEYRQASSQNISLSKSRFFMEDYLFLESHQFEVSLVLWRLISI